MSSLGVPRTFGNRKIPHDPWDEDVGYETLWRSEETYYPPAREGDDYGSWARSPSIRIRFSGATRWENAAKCITFHKRSPLPAELGAEWWVADRAMEEITKSDSRPFFRISPPLLGPHPPLAPPILQSNIQS